MKYTFLSVVKPLLLATTILSVNPVYAETVSILQEPEKWTLMAINNKEIAIEYFPGQSPYISLHDNNDFNGFLGCSDVSGKYSATNSGTISFSSFTTSNKSKCAEYVLTLEEDFLQALTNAKSWSLGFLDALRLYDADKQEIALLNGLEEVPPIPQ